MLRILRNIPVVFACVALFVLMGMTACDVLLRSIFNAPIEAATELTRILMVAIVFSVMPHISAKGEHIEVDLTESIISRLGIERLRDTILYIMCGLMLLWPIGRVWTLSKRLYNYGDVTEYLAIPQYYATGFITLSLAATCATMIVTGLLYAFKPSIVEGLK